MTRARSGVVNKKRHKKILKMAKGFQGRGNNCFRVAVQRVEKSLQYAYRDRRTRKRDFRALWIQRINAAVRTYGLVYSKFMEGMKFANVEIDRKILADMAVHDAENFKAIALNAAKALEEKNSASQKKAS